MENGTCELDRRDFLRRFAAAGLPGGAETALLLRPSFAMAPGHMAEGIRKVQGSVTINGSPAQVNAMVFPGDSITTGRSSLAVSVVGQDAYLLRENSRFELVGEGKGTAQQAGSTKVVKTLRLSAGQVLSVFGPGGKRLGTVTAGAGARGTGVYAEAEPEVTYP